MILRKNTPILFCQKSTNFKQKIWANPQGLLAESRPTQKLFGRQPFIFTHDCPNLLDMRKGLTYYQAKTNSSLVLCDITIEVYAIKMHRSSLQFVPQSLRRFLSRVSLNEEKKKAHTCRSTLSARPSCIAVAKYQKMS